MDFDPKLMATIGTSFITSLYEKYESLGNLCSELKLVYGQYNCIKKYLEITALGKVFKEVCIKDSL